MKKLLIYFMTFIIISIFCNAQECQKENLVNDIPCTITTTYNLDNNCDSYYISIYNSSGDSQNYTNFDNVTGTFYCNYTFNINNIGTYYYNTSFGETGSIKVTNEKMGYQTALVIIIISMISMFIYFAFHLSDYFNLVKSFFLLFTILLAPLTILIMGQLMAQYNGDTSMVKFFEILIYPISIVSLAIFFYILKQISFDVWKKKKQY